MLRRFLTNALILLGTFAAMYALTFWLLCTVELGGTPLVYSCVDAMQGKGGNSYLKFLEYDPHRRHDVVILGSSHAYRGYDPAFFARRGYSAFNLGSSAQSPMNSYHILRTYLTRGNTGLVLFDAYEAVMESNGLEGTADLTQNISSDAAAFNMAMALRDPRGIDMLALRWFRRHAPPLYTDSTYLPGGAALNTDSVTGSIHYVVGKPLVMQEDQQRYLHRFFALCAERGIPVVIVCHPFPRQADRKKHAEFMAWLRQEVEPFGYPLYDFAFGHGLPLDDRDHFYDHNHLNRAGVGIFDPFLIDRLERDGVLRDSAAR